MANHCYNHILVYNISSENIEKLKNWLRTYEDFSYLNNWVNSIVPVLDRLTPTYEEGGDPYIYGGRWFDFGDVDDLEEDGNSIKIEGDSAWSPMLGMCQILSKVFDCEICIEYSESGMDFSGSALYAQGNQKESWEGTYTEGQYVLGDGLSSILEEASFRVDECNNEEVADFMKECKSFMEKSDYKELTKHIKERRNKKKERC